MEPFTTHTGIIAPLDRANIDTDAIIPKQYLTSIHRSGFGDCLFDNWRYLESGTLDSDHGARTRNPDFVLNQAPYKNASVLLTQRNFGCGSSREHAPWALRDFGFRAIIAPSFAEIFANNCSKNNLLLITLPQDTIDTLFALVCSHPGVNMCIDLPKQRCQLVFAADDNDSYNDSEKQHTDQYAWLFTIDKTIKGRLLHGLDDIGLTLAHSADIQKFSQARRQRLPWL